MTMPNSAFNFDERASLYDQLIDWSKRLSNEGPFFREAFEQVGAKRVLDAACGTGRHACMFHGWGLQVEGADLSPGMISECRARCGEPPGLRWVERPFDQMPEMNGPFDAVVCVGNSLALAGDMRMVERAVATLLKVMRPGGVCILQVLNLWSLPENTTVWQKCKRVQHAGVDHILLKSVRKHGGLGHVDLVDLQLTDGGVTSRYDSADFIGIEGDELKKMLYIGGANDVQLFGSYQKQPYNRMTSADLIAVCHRGE